MIKSVREKSKLPVEIDLTGPEGNAYVLLGFAKKFSTAMEKDWPAIEKEMMSSDYENLVEVFDREFGDVVVLYR